MIALHSTPFAALPHALLTDEIRALCEPARELTPAERLHLATAVAFFLWERPGLSRERPALSRVTARAVRSIGFPHAAHRVLIVGLGLLHPLATDLAPGLPAWGLDLLPLASDPHSRCELIFFRALDALLRALAPLWEDNKGLGLLALRRSEPAAAALLGDPTGQRTLDLRREMLARCRQRLSTIAEERQWTAPPHVFLLDGGQP